MRRISSRKKITPQVGIPLDPVGQEALELLARVFARCGFEPAATAQAFVEIGDRVPAALGRNGTGSSTQSDDAAHVLTLWFTEPEYLLEGKPFPCAAQHPASRTWFAGFNRDLLLTQSCNIYSRRARSDALGGNMFRARARSVTAVHLARKVRAVYAFSWAYFATSSTTHGPDAQARAGRNLRLTAPNFRFACAPRSMSELKRRRSR